MMDMVGATALILAVAFIVWSAVRAVERDADHARRVKGNPDDRA